MEERLRKRCMAAGGSLHTIILTFMGIVRLKDKLDAGDDMANGVCMVSNPCD